MFSTLAISAPELRPEGKRPRNKYSRVICLGCRERRIRCELPRDVEIPRSGELQEVRTPCYRCRRLDIPCLIRQTILGRPSAQSSAVSAAHSKRATTTDIKSCIWIDTSLPTQSATIQLETPLVHDPTNFRTRSRCPNDLPLKGDARYWNEGRLLLHKPQSPETVAIIHAIDTLRCEHVEEEWFRHLPAHYGHTPALDLAVKALVQACAYTRGVARLTSRDCFQALSPVLRAVQANIKQSHGQPNDDILAATALLAPFEGVIKRDGIPTRLHVDGLAAIIAVRPGTQAVTQLAKDILDWYAAESFIMACIQGTPSPFEKIPRAYFASDGPGCGDSDRAQLKALSNELFICTPRLVMLVRTLRLQPSPQHELLLGAHGLLQSLLELQNPQVGMRFMQTVTVQLSNGPNTTPSLSQILHFTSVKDYEALTCYWQSRLSLLRLERRLRGLLASRAVQIEGTDAQTSFLSPSFGPHTDEMCLLAKYILMSAEYASTLPLFKQQHLLAHAMVVVWGATIDTSVKQGAERTDSLSELLLRRVNRALNTKLEFSAKDMDEAADIFVGGERRGRLARLYSL
ncbi:hypothetical protein LTR37_021014 [Vermiconidia calcicola]|uniref:Uncharacterized protein n=1 Tax=Vermiconidia calcicola TaxID=1690605 RepID=A0ACC3M9K5_9PEZI|nr:hypothetical protein LTR37_021014 [Vermiconidia calcicola]